MSSATDLDHLNPLVLFVAERRTAKYWTRFETSWDDFASRICDIDSWAEDKDCGGYVPGIFRTEGRTGRARRRTDTLVSRSVATLDFDSATEDAPEVFESAKFALVAHTTWSHDPSAPRWRVLVPLSRPVSPEEYQSAVAGLAKRLRAAGDVDPASLKPAQFMFWPATPDPEVAETIQVPGQAVDALKVIAEGEADLDDVIAADDGRSAARSSKSKRDPFDLNGIPGAFNRLYGTDTARLIADFNLPYEPTSDPNRWRYAGAKSGAGFGPIAGREGLWYSNHVTDPAYGSAQNAFDLVRLHNYALLDEGTSDKTPVNNRPSAKALVAELSKREDVTFEVARVDFTTEDGEPIQIDDWRTRLERSASGAVAKTPANIDLMAAHDEILSTLAFNELTWSREWTEDPPWRETKSNPVVNSGDIDELYLYLEDEYGLKLTVAEMERWLTRSANARRHHPIRDYLESLSWDGVERMETCLPGVDDTEYTRMVTRKMMVAAAGRMLEPGLKFDHLLILRGKEGLGKTWWLERMARRPEWLVSLDDVNHKDTLQRAHQAWFLVSDEGHSMRRADVAALKGFVTRTSDTFRAPYERHPENHKRAFTLWATTNDDVFLTAQEGNRRYWVVDIERRADFDKYTDEYVDQVWAEAVAAFKNGERLFLTKTEEALAEQARASSVEENRMVGLVEDYLCTRFPPEFLSWKPAMRRDWYNSGSHGGPDGVRLTRVCTRQVWIEALNNRFGQASQAELREIREALRHLGWQAVGRKTIPGYGTNEAYEPPHGWDYGPDRRYDPIVDEPEAALAALDFSQVDLDEILDDLI